ncbi:MAG TPA: hypothetical protein HPP54_10395 [Nitrospinae bacterium]|nr:hypothetical protein [Nitrospinota bacterium]
MRTHYPENPEQKTKNNYYSTAATQQYSTDNMGYAPPPTATRRPAGAIGINYASSLTLKKIESEGEGWIW